MKRIWMTAFTCIVALGMLTGCGSEEEEKPAVKIVQPAEDEAREAEEGKKKEKKENQEKEEEKESVLDDAEVFADGEESLMSEGEEVSIVLEGIKMQIPGEYGCFIEETKGPIVYRDDLFTLLIAVRDNSYEEEMKNPENLMAGAARVGGEVTKEIEEIEIQGKKYAYYKYTNGGDDFIVVYTAAPDNSRRLCAQILIRSQKEGDEGLLKHWADIAASAVETDEEDTTQESLTEAKRLADFGDKKEESTLVYEDAEIAFGVAPGFYSTYTDSDEISACEFFTAPDDYRTLDCTLKPNYGLSAEEYIENEAQFGDWDNMQTGSIKVGNHTFYYVEAKYMYDGNEFQKIKAACDIGDDYTYTISATAIDVEKRIELEDYENFMKVEEQ